MNKADQRKRKAKKKNRLAPVSWKDTNKGHRLGPKRTVDELPLDQQKKKVDQRKRKAKKKNRLAPVSWKDTIKGHRHGPK